MTSSVGSTGVPLLNPQPLPENSLLNCSNSGSSVCHLPVTPLSAPSAPTLPFSSQITGRRLCPTGLAGPRPMLCAVTTPPSGSQQVRTQTCRLPELPGLTALPDTEKLLGLQEQLPRLGVRAGTQPTLLCSSQHFASTTSNLPGQTPTCSGLLWQLTSQSHRP